MGLQYILFRPLSKNLLQLPRKYQDSVCDNLAAKLSLYTC